MSLEKLNYLALIYNNLMTIETKGESLLILAKCLNDLQHFIIDEQNNIKERKEITNGS